RIDNFVTERYASWREGIGQKIRDHAVTLEDCAAYAAEMKKPENPGSGRQEYLEAIVNNILFGSKC
ncbi:MAG: xylose isomerase, partial [Clostridia bacterium]|nr:xylose isomerase [Clostridia bacterium]